MITDTIKKILSVEPTTFWDLCECIPADGPEVYVALEGLIEDGEVRQTRRNIVARYALA